MIKETHVHRKTGKVINMDKYEPKDFKRSRCYAVFMRNKETNELVGYVENSFSMGWDKTRVNIWRPYMWRGTYNRREVAKMRCELALNMQKCVKGLQEKYPDHDVFCTRVGSKNCPVKIDWMDHWTNTCRDKKSSKYNWRNLKFTPK